VVPQMFLLSRVPLAIQTTKGRAYLRHAYVFLRSLPRQWNCRATIVRPYGTKIQDLMLTPMPVIPLLISPSN